MSQHQGDKKKIRMGTDLSEVGSLIMTVTGQESRLASHSQAAKKMTTGNVGHIGGAMNVSIGVIRNMTKMNSHSISGIVVIITVTVGVAKRVHESGIIELPGGGVPETETCHVHLVPVETILIIANVIEKDTPLHLHAQRHPFSTRSCSQQAHLMNRQRKPDESNRRPRPAKDQTRIPWNLSLALFPIPPLPM